MAKSKLSDAEFRRLLQETRQDPQSHNDIHKFIKITTNSYKLEDYGLD